MNLNILPLKIPIKGELSTGLRVRIKPQAYYALLRNYVIFLCLKFSLINI